MPSGFSFLDRKHYFIYVLMLLFFVAAVPLILWLGPTSPQTNSNASGTSLTAILWQNFRSPLGILLVQIVVILVAAGVLSRLFRRIGQPPVMGEMIAGIVLGPSVLGFFFPQAMSFIFPDSSLETLRLLSQIGVVLFMFIVGMELNVRHVKEKGSAAVMISHASIIVPFVLGTSLSLFLYRDLAPPGTSFTAFALFIGVAMSITAFPVLARILEDRNLTQTDLGSIALTCAAVDDVTAWCILAGYARFYDPVCRGDDLFNTPAVAPNGEPGYRVSRSHAATDSGRARVCINLGPVYRDNRDSRSVRRFYCRRRDAALSGLPAVSAGEAGSV
jgi:hypothetical protein